MKKKIQQVCQWGLVLSVVGSGILAPLALAAPVDFHLQIRPLECSVDTLSSGTNIITQVSPDCLPVNELPLLENDVNDMPRAVDENSPSSQQLFYVPFPTGYDSAQPSQQVKTPSRTVQYPVDLLLPTAIVVLASASVVLSVTHGSAGVVGLRRLLGRLLRLR